MSISRTGWQAIRERAERSEKELLAGNAVQKRSYRKSW